METSQPDPDLFSVRIVSVDYYMAPPITDVDFCYSSFQGGKVNEVPVVRVYGSTPAGQKTCLHVHRALPYLYVPCSSLIQASEEGDRYLRDMSSAIEKALKSKTKSSSGSKRQHVHGCSLVRARKFYGFHSSEDLFVKIYLYYPQEVARVATLLLDGAILDRSYQPHESHIPYLLQFLVDYNLFGMGHLHLSKVKFRYPLPEEFISRAARRSDLSGHATVKMACTSGKREADSCTHSCPGLSVWTCTTIPSGWMWPPAVTSNSSPDDACFIKRQSACELEADATVDEIVNQQKKMYTSLSQTRSEVKMVQSLVPIWQEEYERTGMHEQVVIELSKPLPQNVLRTFSHGSECENALMDLCREAEKSSSSQVTHKHQAERFLQSIRSLADVGNICGMGEHVNLNFVDSVSSQGSLSEQGDSAGPSELRHSFPEIGPANEDMASSDKIDNSDTKGIDTEALGLLKWLASSQADDELNTDDELGYDLILTPLLPKTAIGKILEKANLDYECESQQECQDILDSVVDMESHMLKEQALQSTSDKPSTAVNIIPQVDGSCDDQVTGCSGNVPEINLNKEKGKSSQRAQQGIDVSARNEKKKRTRLWGPLPLASQHKVGEDSESSSFDSADVSEMKICTSSSANKDDVSCDDAVNCVNTSKFVLKEQKELAGGSVRDLMRRKRYRRFEHSELGTGESNPFHVGIKQDQMSIRPKKLEFLVKDDDREVKMAIGTSGKQLASDQETTAYERSLNLEKCEETCTYGVRPADGDIPTYGGLPLVSCIDSSFEDGTSKTGYVTSHKQRHNFENFGVPSGTQSMLPDVSLLHSETKEVQKSLISVKLDTNTDSGQLECPKDEKLESFSRFLMSTEKWRPDICSVTIESSEAPLNAVVLQIEKSTIEPIICTSSCPSALVEAPSEAMHTKCIEMSFIQKPPTVDWRSWTLENTQFAPILHDQTFIEKKTSNGTLGCHSGSQEFEGSYAEDIIPFFSDDVKDGEEYHEFYRTENVIISSQEAGLGIPTHFQNDGSLLYLLTTVNSAPSVNCVHEWLFHNQPRRHTTGTAVESTHSKFLDSASPSRCNSLQFSKESAFGDDKGASELPKLHAALTGKSDIRNSQEILLKVSPGSLLKSGSVNYKKPFVEQLSPPNPTDLKTETTNQDFTTKHHGEAAILKGNERTESQQDVSQISGPYMRSKLTPLSQIGFRDPASVGDGQQLTLMSIEVQAESRGDLRPDPRFDAITIIAIMIQEDNDHSLDAFVLLCGGGDESNGRNLDGISGCTILVALEEKHLFHHFVKIVRSYDPDVLMGWEIQGSSLGFLAERAAHLGIKLLENISRTPSSEIKVPAKNFTNQETAVPEDVPPEALFTDPTTFEDSIIEDEWGRTHASGVHVGGRIVLNIWRLIRGEIKLNIYTIDAVAEEVLRRKVPTIPPRILMQWFSSGPGRARYRCIEYILGRAKLNLEILNQLDMINRTSELARVFGIDFFSVLSRGSQYRVESMFLRLAHTQNYLAVSPGNQQVASQPAMECLPLVMEPESNFYADPVVVLDFQSLYPSMIIAYNLCFCTCLGKVLPAKPNTLGVSSFLPDSQLLADLKDKILLTPNGVMYVPSEVRKGVLPRLLEEILSTRIMVKQAMKNLTTQRVLHRIFNARQLALKLISNVTYGYTAAGFSGRMPCAELADSIVQCGRRTLESAISFVNSHEKWNARVVYGDTDSMFVLLRGRTVKESFGIGQEIASVITSMNPDPVTLKMEKVYHPCFLLTKKRYVGYSYENMDQTEPFFDAKGIETVRRDSCGAVAKTMEQSLRFFFEHQDISKVKVYLQRQWTRILAGRVSLQDFVFAKEVRLGTYSAGSSSLPPAAIVATKAMKCDPRAEPRYGERIPYVVIHGEPGARLVDMVVDPMELLAIESPFRMNDSYYINKQIIPALQRVFGIVGADLRQCFLEMPRHMRPSLGKQFSYAPNGQKMRIDSYYLSSHCFLCGELVQASKHLCDKCFEKESAAATAICSRTSRLEMDIDHLAAICRHCGGGDWIVESGIKCVSLACTLFYERRKVQKELQSLSAVATEMGFYPKCMPEWF